MLTKNVQPGVQQFAASAAGSDPQRQGSSGANEGPFLRSEAEAPQRIDGPVCPNPKCSLPLDAESLFRCRCQHCKGVLSGNQNARRYPKRPDENDPAVQQQLRQDRDSIISDRGGRDRLSTIQLRQIDQLVVLGLFLQSWEQFFLAASPITKGGRVRSGYAQGYLATLDRYVRLAQQIGVTLIAHDISDMTIEDYMAAWQALPQAQHDHAPEGGPNNEPDSATEITGRPKTDKADTP